MLNYVSKVLSREWGEARMLPTAGEAVRARSCSDAIIDTLVYCTMVVRNAAINSLHAYISEQSECNRPAMENKRRQFMSSNAMVPSLGPPLDCY